MTIHAWDLLAFYLFFGVVILGVIPGSLAAAPFVAQALRAGRDAFVEAVRK